MAPPRPHDAGERRAHLAQPPPGPLRSTLPDQPHQLAPDDDAVRLPGGFDSRLGRADTEPQCDRRIGLRTRPPQQLDGAGGQGVAHTRHTGDRDAVDEPGGKLTHPREPLVRRGGRHERAEGYASFRREPRELACLVHGQVGNDEPRDPRRRGLAHELLDSAGEDHVVIEEKDYRDAVREGGGEVEAVVEVCTVLDGPCSGVLDRGSVCQRIGEGHTYLHNVSAGRDVGLPHLPRPFQGGIPARQVRDERNPVVSKRRHEPLATRHRRPLPP